MPKINVLPPQIAELIAAGEVVENPASVIKEAVENSLDAGATQITVEIRRGGILYMRITDNGCGIAAADVPLSFLRHATSKVVTAADLDRIFTLGFRGEALASVCAVARVEMSTRPETQSVGTYYRIEGGVELENRETGCPVGTTLIVRDLFYNTPARMKFLHKDTYEASLVTDLTERLALSHPEVAFCLIKDGKTVLNTPGDGKLTSAVYTVLGREFSSGMIPVEHSFDGIRVSGMVCRPIYCRAKRNAQYFFLNGRTIKSQTACAALEQAYKNSAMIGKFPSCVLNLEVAPETVDVNVHPTKTQVRFSNEKAIFSAVYYAVKGALEQHDRRPEISIKKPVKFETAEKVSAREYLQTVLPTQFPEKKQDTPGEFSSGIHFENCPTESQEQKESSASKPQNSSRPPEKWNFAQKAEVEIASEPEPLPQGRQLSEPPPEKRPMAPFIQRQEEAAAHQEQPEKTPLPSESLEKSQLENAQEEIRYIGEAFSTYILVEKGESIFCIDKHAAHERILFEQLKKQANLNGQELLEPVCVKLPPASYEAVLESHELLRQNGLETEDFGNSSVLVRSVPSALQREDAADLIAELATGLAQSGNIESHRLEDLYHTVACKAAIKAGFDTPREEQIRLAREVLSRRDIFYCPHGRPVAFEIKKRELERQFGRIQS